MNIKDLMSLSSAKLESMTEAELRKIANALASASNKRIRRLVGQNLQNLSLSLNQRKLKSGKIKPFSIKLKKSLYPKRVKHRKISYKSENKIEKMRKTEMAYAKKRKNALISKIGSMRNFLTSPSSTIPGAKATASALARDISERYGADYDSLSTYQKNRFWEAYTKIREKKPNLFDENNSKYLKYREALLEIMLLPGKKNRLRNLKDSISMMEEYLKTGKIPQKPSSPFKVVEKFEKTKIF